MGWYINLANDYRKTNYRNSHLAGCAEAIVPNLAQFFLAIAVILNINKWIYFNFYITTNVKANRLSYVNTEVCEDELVGI